MTHTSGRVWKAFLIICATWLVFLPTPRRIWVKQSLPFSVIWSENQMHMTCRSAPLQEAASWYIRWRRRHLSWHWNPLISHAQHERLIVPLSTDNKCYCMMNRRRGSTTAKGDCHISLCMIIQCQWRAGQGHFASHYLQLSQMKLYQEDCLIPHSDCTALESSILIAWCREGKKIAGICSELILFLQFW